MKVDAYYQELVYQERYLVTFPYLLRICFQSNQNLKFLAFICAYFLFIPLNLESLFVQLNKHIMILFYTPKWLIV